MEPLRRAVAEEGYTTPTPIQQQAIPHLLEGKDLLGCAQTGTGKTAAFTLPLLQEMSGTNITPKARSPRALILSPTRELAAQIGDSITTYGRHVRVSHTVIFGGVGQNPQVKAMQRGVDVGKEFRRAGPPSDEERKVMFNQTAQTAQEPGGA